MSVTNLNSHDNPTASDQELEIAEANNARVAGIHTHYVETKREIYATRNKAIMESRFNLLVIIAAHRKATQAIMKLWEITSK